MRKWTIFFAFVLIAPAFPSGNSFETITDVDLGFLVTNPKGPWGDDPFLKEPGYAETLASSESFVLEAVIYSEKNPMARVNGELVHLGDSVQGRKVVEIGENYVLLRKNSSTIEVNLPSAREEPVEEVEQ